MEPEGIEQEIILEPENAIVGAVYSVNGQTGHVVLTTSDLENTSDYQTGSDVSSAISTHNSDEEAHPYIQGQFAGKQDKLTAGSNIQISEQNVISATDTTYSAGNGINISGSNAISVDTTIVATQQNLSDEVTNRENADIYLQQQIDGISASSDVVDIVGTYAELQNYDTQHLKDNDIIKVLQDETQNGATTYYRWSTSTHTFTLIGQEGPYYTKAAADAEFVPQTRTVNGKALSSNIVLNASDVSALGTSDVVQTTGSSTSQVMSQKATTDALDTKLNTTDYVVDTQLADSNNPVQNRVLNGLLGDMPSDFFSGSATTTSTASTELQFGNILGLDNVQLLGDTFQQTYSGKNLIHFNPETRSNGGIDYTITNDTIVGTGVTTGTNSVASSNYYFPTPLSAGTYTFSIPQALSVQIFLSVIDDNSRFHNFTIQPGDTSVTVTTDYTMERYRLDFTGWTAGDSVSISLPNRLQLEAGSSVTPYEPFVGGTASPNPDYPQDIQVVTGEQTVKVTGKNLFDKNNPNTINGYIDSSVSIITANVDNRTIWIPCKPNTTYTIQKLPVTSNYRRSIGYTTELPAIGVQFYGEVHGTNGWSNLSITTGDDAKYLVVRIWVSTQDQTTLEQMLNSIQIEQGPATPYEPYQSQTYTIDLGSTELCKIDTYQDYIYKSGDDWYVHKETKKETITSVSGTYGNTGSGYYGASYTATDMMPNSRTNGYCNRFTAQFSPVGSTQEAITYGVTSSNLIIITMKDTRIPSSTLANWNSWLASNNLIVCYPLDTPTDTKITDSTLISELEALLNVNTYDGETDFVITATGTNLAAPLQLTAVNANAQGIIYKLRG